MRFSYKYLNFKLFGLKVELKIENLVKLNKSKLRYFIDYFLNHVL